MFWGFGMTWLFALLGFVGFSAHASPLLQPQPLSDEAYGEAYTAVAALEDGSFVLLQLMFSNAGFGSRKAACRALWVPPGKAGINASARFDSSEWAYEADSDTLKAGTCHLGSSGDGLQFRASTPELTVELNIQAKARSVKPPGHRVEHKQSFYQAELMVPYARTTATVTTADTTLNTKGAVHMDHSRSNVLMPNAAACWLRFRGFFGAKPMLIQVRVPPNGGVPDAWSWPLNEPAPSPIAGEQVQLGTDEAGRPTITISGSEGLTLGTTAQLYRYRPAESYGALGKLASPWIGDPTTTTYRAKATSESGSAVTGILEVLEVDDPGCVTQ